MERTLGEEISGGETPGIDKSRFRDDHGSGRRNYKKKCGKREFEK